MLLRNVQIVGEKGSWDICYEKDFVQSVTAHRPSAETEENSILFDNSLAFPGLVNSHDHLDFNLFPQLANRQYNNYREWGLDIHKANRAAIDKVLNIPQTLRTEWGLYKNLLNGITTVVNHGPVLDIAPDLITVFQDCYSLHSPGFERNWRWKLNRRRQDRGVIVMHMGEGIDKTSFREINSVLRWNLRNKQIIGIHGVAMNGKQAAKLKALIWCPASNQFLFHKTAEIVKLKNHTSILFGTDSTLTSSWDIWEQLKLARSMRQLSDEELFHSLTTTAHRIWNLPGSGEIAGNEPADIIVANMHPSSDTFDAFYKICSGDILLIVHKGNIRVFDESLKTQLVNTGLPLDCYHCVNIEGRIKYVYGNLAALTRNIHHYYPESAYSSYFRPCNQTSATGYEKT
jgi:cytosine/adenosine deaminase-related metal-dependent hydrolase